MDWLAWTLAALLITGRATGEPGNILGMIFSIFKKARADSNSLIETMIKNAEQNLGVVPDAASISHFARHPFLAAKVYRLLGEAGGNNAVGWHDDETAHASLTLTPYLEGKFRKKYPCASAIIQYAIYLAVPLEWKTGINHPKDEQELLGAEKCVNE